MFSIKHEGHLNKNNIIFDKRLGQKKQIRDRVILKQNASGKSTKKWSKLLASLDIEIKALENKITQKRKQVMIVMHHIVFVHFHIVKKETTLSSLHDVSKHFLT